MSRLFDGIDDTLAVSSAAVTAAPLTLACWFFTSDATNSQVLVQVDDATTSNRFALIAAGATGGDPVQAQTIAAGSSGTAATSTGYATGSWQHACAVFAATNDRRAFINGSSKGTDTNTRGPTGIAATRLGCNAIGSSPFSGQIAEVAIFNRALADGEIAALANRVHPRRFSGLLGYYPLWGIADPEMDLTAGQRHLTVTGATVAAHAPVSSYMPGQMSPQVTVPTQGAVGLWTGAEFAQRGIKRYDGAAFV